MGFEPTRNLRPCRFSRPVTGSRNELLAQQTDGGEPEVLNYRRALREAVELLGTRPLCGRLLKQIHATLMSGVRGHDKARGKYRTVPNYTSRGRG